MQGIPFIHWREIGREEFVILVAGHAAGQHIRIKVMIHQERPVVTLNPAIDSLKSVTFFNEMLMGVDQGRGKDFSKDRFAYIVFLVEFFAGHACE